MNVFNGIVNNNEQKAIKTAKQKIEPVKSSEDAKTGNKINNEQPVVAKTDNPATQSQTRNISFKRNEDSKTMYIEITNEDDEVIRTIPADEKDPRFIELVAQSTPGMIINNKS